MCRLNGGNDTKDCVNYMIGRSERRLKVVCERDIEVLKLGRKALKDRSGFMIVKAS